MKFQMIVADSIDTCLTCVLVSQQSSQVYYFRWIKLGFRVIESNEPSETNPLIQSYKLHIDPTYLVPHADE